MKCKSLQFKFNSMVQGYSGINGAQLCKNNSSETHVDWPPQTPDFNPAEDLWLVMEKTSHSTATLHHLYDTSETAECNPGQK